MATPEFFQRSIEIWREDEWARRAAYISATLAFTAFGAGALGEISLFVVLTAGAGWMTNNAISYFN